MSKSRTKLNMAEQVFPALEGVKEREFDFNTISKIVTKVFPSKDVRTYWRKIKFTPSIADIALIISKDDDMDFCDKVELMRSLLKFANKETATCIEKYLDDLQSDFEEFEKPYLNATFELQAQIRQDDGSFSDYFSVGLFMDIATLFVNAVRLKKYDKYKDYKLSIAKRILLQNQDFKDIKDDGGEYYVLEQAAEMYFTDDGYLKKFRNGEISNIEFSDSFLIGSFSVDNDGSFEDKYVSLPFPFHKGDIVHDITDDSYGVLLTAPTENQSFAEFEQDKANDFKDNGFSKYCRVYCLCDNGRVTTHFCHCYNLELVKEEDNSPRYCYLQKLKEFVIGTPDPIGFTYAMDRYVNSLKEANDREG